MKKISIIGAGNVGSGIAYEIASRGLVDELALVDIVAELAEGQAADIQQALPYRNQTKVYSGGYEKITGSDIVIVTAGKPRTPEINDRLQLAEFNLNIVTQVAKEIKKYAPETIIITVTNPMDVVNHFFYKKGFLRKKIVGFGGQLDSSRFRITLGFPEKKIEAYVLGEHGQNQVPLFSKIKINDQKITFSKEEQKKIYLKLRETSLNVIKKKGATIYAPASNNADMVEAIIKDQKKLMICSINLEGEYGLRNVSLGVPVILGQQGVEKVEEWNLSQEEQEQMQEAATKLKQFYDSATKAI